MSYPYDEAEEYLDDCYGGPDCICAACCAAARYEQEGERLSAGAGLRHISEYTDAQLRAIAFAALHSPDAAPEAKAMARRLVVIEGGRR